MGRARVALTIAAWAATLAPASAYYHYLHYTAFGTAQEKFDLNALPNRTLTFFVSDASPSQYGPNDSFPSVLSQVRQAALAWNAVDTSDLRVAFGGLMTQGTPQNTPNGLVVFEDIPPGLLAYSTRTVADPATGPTGPFVPITQGMVHLNRNMASQPGPSYLEAFFTTVLHEMGHAIGLQHTYTSSAMSTAVTRSTSRTKPLDADDIAAVSLLYPGRTFAGTFGSITGHVTSGGQPLHMASVVALPPTGPAVSALTNPDGSFRIDGVPPGTYWVYVHPLPPAADFQYPTDQTGRPVPPSGAFETLFYPGTRDPRQFTPVMVTRGNTVAGIDFSVQRRTSPAIYDVATYTAFGQSYVSPAYLNTTISPGTLVARGTGITAGPDTVTPGLGAQILGGFASMYAMRAYGAPQTSLAMYLTYPFSAGTGPRHLLFTLPNDAYVLPSAVNLVQKQPPVVLAAVPGPDGTVTVAGANLSGDSRVFFDGLQASVRVPFSGNDQSGVVVVAPPPGASNQTATVTVYNADGQSSMFTQAQNPPVYSYGPADPAIAAVTPNTLPAGVSAMVDVTGSNTRFVDGQVTLGFGSSDVFVRRVWVLSPTHLIANVVVAANAVPTTASLVNVISGFQSFAQPFGFQVQPANPRVPTVALPLVNANPNQSGIYPGAAVSAYGTNLALSPTSVNLTVNDQPAQVLFASAGQINFLVPAGTAIGPAVVRLNNGSDAAYPVVMQVDPAPPVVMGVLSSLNQPIDGARPAQAGDVLNILLANLDPAVASSPGRVRVNVGGTEMPALFIMPAPGQPNFLQAQVILGPTASGAQVPVTVTLDGGAASTPVYIAVR